MIRHLLPLSLFGLVACGGDGDDTDGPGNVAQTITLSGTAVEVKATGSDPLEGVSIEAFTNVDENTPITSTTTNAEGSYTLTVETTGALNGFLKATKAGVLDTYLYPDKPLTEDFDGASINMISSETLGLLTNDALCGETQSASSGLIAALALSAPDAPLAGVTLSSSPAPTSVCYNANGFPDGDATVTGDDGVGYLFNVTGNVSVSASATGTTFPSHSVTARAGALTTTLFR